MIDCQFSKILFSIGAVKIHFYGAIAAAALFFAIFLAKKLVVKFPKKFATLRAVDFENLAVYLVGFGFFGARLFYVLFYNLEFFAGSPIEIFKIYNGGLSVHGGIFGGLLGLFFFARKFKIPFWDLANFVAPLFALGLGFGRFGNFINGELVGRETDFFFACDFGDGVPRFPVQLLGALKNFTIAAILFFHNFRGGKFGSAGFLISIGLFRFLVEFLREPDAQLGFIFWKISAGQIFAIATFLIGIAIFFVQKKRRKI